jgi:hypothetical protein
LKSKGIKVAASQVYQIISVKKRGKKRIKRPERTAIDRSEANSTVIDSAIVFVRQAGGMTKARDLLSKLAELHGRPLGEGSSEFIHCDSRIRQTDSIAGAIGCRASMAA